MYPIFVKIHTPCSSEFSDLPALLTVDSITYHPGYGAMRLACSEDDYFIAMSQDCCDFIIHGIYDHVCKGNDTPYCMINNGVVVAYPDNDDDSQVWEEFYKMLGINDTNVVPTITNTD